MDGAAEDRGLISSARGTATPASRRRASRLEHHDPAAGRLSVDETCFEKRPGGRVADARAWAP